MVTKNKRRESLTPQKIEEMMFELSHKQSIVTPNDPIQEDRRRGATQEGGVMGVGEGMSSEKADAPFLAAAIARDYDAWESPCLNSSSNSIQASRNPSSRFDRRQFQDPRGCRYQPPTTFTHQKNDSALTLCIETSLPPYDPACACLMKA